MYGTARPEVTVTPLAADKLDLSGKRVHVIGGTSGIGRALALSCAAKGQNATAIKCNPEFEPKGRATEWYTAMEAIVKRCAGI